MKTKFPATVMVFGMISSEGHIMPPVGFKPMLRWYYFGCVGITLVVLVALVFRC